MEGQGERDERGYGSSATDATGSARPCRKFLSGTSASGNGRFRKPCGSSVVLPTASGIQPRGERARVRGSVQTAKGFAHVVLRVCRCSRGRALRHLHASRCGNRWSSRCRTVTAPAGGSRRQPQSTHQVVGGEVAITAASGVGVSVGRRSVSTTPPTSSAGGSQAAAANAHNPGRCPVGVAVGGRATVADARAGVRSGSRTRASASRNRGVRGGTTESEVINPPAVSKGIASTAFFCPESAGSIRVSSSSASVGFRTASRSAARLGIHPQQWCSFSAQITLAPVQFQQLLESFKPQLQYQWAAWFAGGAALRRRAGMLSFIPSTGQCCCRSILDERRQPPRYCQSTTCTGPAPSEPIG